MAVDSEEKELPHSSFEMEEKSADVTDESKKNQAAQMTRSTSGGVTQGTREARTIGVRGPLPGGVYVIVEARMADGLLNAGHHVFLSTFTSSRSLIPIVHQVQDNFLPEETEEGSNCKNLTGKSGVGSRFSSSPHLRRSRKHRRKRKSTSGETNATFYYSSYMPTRRNNHCTSDESPAQTSRLLQNFSCTTVAVQPSSSIYGRRCQLGLALEAVLPQMLLTSQRGSPGIL